MINMFIVYKTTCLVNNKIYIGVHETSNPEVFDGYIGNGINIFNRKYNIENPKFPFHYAVKKYGINNFRRSILFQYVKETDAYAKEEEIVNEDFLKRDDVYNICLGGKRPRAITKKLYQFTYTGVLVNTYDTTILASKLNEITYNILLSAISSKRGTHGYYWSYESRINLDEFGYKEFLHYYVYNQDGDFVKEFETNAECVAFLDTNRGNLTRAIKLSNKINGYFITTEKLDKVQVTITRLSGQLNRYTLDGKYIDSFKTIAEAKRITGLKLCSISQAIRLNRQCNGFRWTRTDNPTPTIEVSQK